MKPDYAQAYESLGLALSQVGRFSEAVENYQEALAIDPRLVSAANNLAWLLATCREEVVRNGARAIKLAKEASKLAGAKDPAILDTLGAAYAEAGQFRKAIRTQSEALNLARSARQAEQAQNIKKRLNLYQARRAYHT